MYQCFYVHFSCVVIYDCIEKKWRDVFIFSEVHPFGFFFSIICFFSTCCIIFRVGYICVDLTSGRLYVLSLITLKFYGQLLLLCFLFILFLRFCVVVSLSSSMIFGPTLCSPTMFGWVTLLLSCDLVFKSFFAASCTTSSCVGGDGRSYVYFLGGKNTTVSDILSAPVVGTHPL